MLPHPVTRAWVEQRLDTLHPAHVDAFVRLLTELRGLFDGDLDAMLILAAASTGIGGEGWREALFEGRPLAADPRATNTQSLAHATQIPRETVRRKLRRLQEKGWMTRDARGNWRPTAAAATNLAPATRATITYLTTILNAAGKASGRE